MTPPADCGRASRLSRLAGARDQSRRLYFERPQPEAVYGITSSLALASPTTSMATMTSSSSAAPDAITTNPVHRRPDRAADEQQRRAESPTSRRRPSPLPAPAHRRRPTASDPNALRQLIRQPGFTGGAVWVLPNKLKTPYSDQFDLGVRKRFGDDPDLADLLAHRIAQPVPVRASELLQ